MCLTWMPMDRLYTAQLQGCHGGDGVDVEDNLPALDGVMLNHVSRAEGTRQRQLSPAGHRTGWMSPAQWLWCFLSGLK